MSQSIRSKKMKTVANVMLISAKPDGFVDKSGKTVSFQRVVVLQPGDEDSFSLTAPADLDLSSLKPMSPFDAVLDVSKNYQGYPKVKLVGIKA